MTAPDVNSAEAAERSAPEFADTAPVWIKIGLLSFGGPAGQIALMQEEVVDKRGWVSGDAFRRGLAVSMLLPGPEAQQLATWLGWRLHGLRGGLAAGLAFILPGAALMIALAWVAAAQGDNRWIAGIFAGVQPAVIALVARAFWTLSGKALGGPWHWALAAAAFIGIYFLGAPFPLIVALAALAGLALPHAHEDSVEIGPVPRKRDALKLIAVFAALILGVFFAVRLTLGPDPFDGVATLFTSAAFVSFGGAYALLPYVADRAVEAYGWLSAAEMLNGLAIAEATPGPLILVNTYAGFFAGWTGPGTGLAAAFTAALATFYTFAPSFMLILAAAPHVERLQNAPRARRALAGVSAAVVGVILNLAVYLAEASFLPAGLDDPEWAKIALFGLFAVLTFGLKAPMTLLVGLGAASGLALSAMGLF